MLLLPFYGFTWQVEKDTMAYIRKKFKFTKARELWDLTSARFFATGSNIETIAVMGMEGNADASLYFSRITILRMTLLFLAIGLFSIPFVLMRMNTYETSFQMEL
eukprot:2126842-Amphidinium_carterae.1